RGASVGAHARLAGGGERLVAAAAENAHRLGHRLQLGFERGDAAGQRGIAHALRRRGARGFELGHAARDLVEGFRIGGRRRRAGGGAAHPQCDAGEARTERAHAVVAADEQAHEPERGENEADAGDGHAEPENGGHALPRRLGRRVARHIGGQRVGRLFARRGGGGGGPWGGGFFLAGRGGSLPRRFGGGFRPVF